MLQWLEKRDKRYQWDIQTNSKDENKLPTAWTKEKKNTIDRQTNKSTITTTYQTKD